MQEETTTTHSGAPSQNVAPVSASDGGAPEIHEAPAPETAPPRVLGDGPPSIDEARRILKAEFAAWESAMHGLLGRFKGLLVAFFPPASPEPAVTEPPALPPVEPAPAPAVEPAPASVIAAGTRVKVWQDREKKTFALGIVTAVHDGGHSFDVHLEQGEVHVQADGLELDLVS